MGVAESQIIGLRFGSFRNLGVPYFGVLILRILLFRVLFLGSPIFGNSHLTVTTRDCFASKVIVALTVTN